MKRPPIQVRIAEGIEDVQLAGAALHAVLDVQVYLDATEASFKTNA